MKLLTKLTLFITGSKMLIVVVFVLLLPLMVAQVSFQYSNYYLTKQQKKVEEVLAKNGIQYYLAGDSTYGSYTMLKDEYISLTPADGERIKDAIETARRVVENDTLNYLVLTHEVTNSGRKYLLEIGKTTSAISQYNNLLQQFTLYALAALIALSIIIDLVYTYWLLRPLGKIVRTKLVDRKFPFKESLQPVKTSTSDFKYLDNSLISLMEKIHEAFDKEREFTSNASHELMTPVSILQTNLENMMVEDASEEQQEKILAMMKTLKRLRKIVHSLLYISRIENDQFAKKEEVNIRQLISGIMEDLSSRLEIKSLLFSNLVDNNFKLKNVNKDLLFQLFYNLINNAIRYNKQDGAITIRDHYSPEGKRLISIEDSGIGIHEEDLSNIFNRFKKSGHEGGEGYGLGLSIVKSIVSYHGAEISVQSGYGQGTAFTIVFPAVNILF